MKKEEIFEREKRAFDARGFDANLWAVIKDGNAHIFSKAGWDHFDHYIIHAERASVELSVLLSVVNATNTDSDSALFEDDRALLRSFVMDYPYITDEERMKAVVCLWQNTEAFDNHYGESWCRHVDFEDDDETDYESLIALDNDQQDVVDEIIDKFKQLDSLDVGYYVDEDHRISFYNGRDMRLEWDNAQCQVMNDERAMHTDIWMCEWIRREHGFIKK